MKLKLDENMPRSMRALLAAEGHDVATVPSENLCGAPDPFLATVCRREGRCLVTRDLDFANPFAFPPDEHPGIAVIREPRVETPGGLADAAHVFVRAIRSGRSPQGKLWIIRGERLREYGAKEEERP